MTAIIFLTYLSIILIIGIICTIISKKFRIPNIILLLLVGLGIAHIPTVTELKLLEFQPIFLTSIAILALVMIVFDAASRFKMKEFDVFSIQALKLSGIFLVLNAFLLTASSIIIFKIDSLFLALLFAFIMSGTDPGAVSTMFRNVKNKVINLLEVESLLNTPLVVVLPFLLLDFIARIGIDQITYSKFFNQLFMSMPDFFLRFVAGIGSGIVVGLIVFRIMKKQYSETLSPLALITAALSAYILAENLGGNGVLAVTTMGLLFGNIYIKEKGHLFEFSSIFANSLEILVFFLIGMMIKIPFTRDFFIKSILLFVVYLIIRLSSVHLAFYHLDYTFKEKLFMTLNVQKGIAVAVVAFTLMTLTEIQGMNTILNLVLIFMLYSIILSTVVIRFSKHFMKVKINDTTGTGRLSRAGKS